MSVRVDRAGDAAVLTIDRPATKNAIDRATAKLIGDTVRIAAADPSVRGVVITGEGADSFVSGGDLKDLQAIAAGGEGGKPVLEMFEHLSACETCEVPVIAAVQGDVFGGGCELLLLCDLVIMEEHASLAFRHAKMGLSPAWGGMTRLLERVGPIEAARLLFTAEKISAEEARRIGFINQVAPTGAARTQAIARINRIADNPRTTVASLKRTLHAVREASRTEAMKRERQGFTDAWGGEDHLQAMSAFFSRKKG
jgi:enoyl-CoA hydratase/carnithine racemase